MIGGFAVHQRPLPGGVGIDHSPQRRTVAGRQLRGEEIAVGLKILVKLIFNHARFHAHPTLFRVDFNDAIHITGHVDNDALIQRLAVGASAATARGEYQGLKAFFCRQTSQQRDIRRGAREYYRIGKKLVDTVIGRHRQPVGIAGGGIAGKALLLQCLQIIQHQLNYARCLGNLWDHYVWPFLNVVLYAQHPAGLREQPNGKEAVYRVINRLRRAVIVLSHFFLMRPEVFVAESAPGIYWYYYQWTDLRCVSDLTSNRR